MAADVIAAPSPVKTIRLTDAQAKTLMGRGCTRAQVDRCDTIAEKDRLFHYYMNRVTNKQREFLQQHGFTDDEYFSNPLGDRMVAMLMMKLPATDDQMTYLKDVYKRDAITTPIPENLSRAGATKELDRLEMARPRLEWQEKKLRQCGIPSSEWPTNYWDCKAMYEARARPTPDSFDTPEPKARRMTTGTPL